jgi:hypothetical protein
MTYGISSPKTVSGSSVSTGGGRHMAGNPEAGAGHHKSGSSEMTLPNLNTTSHSMARNTNMSPTIRPRVGDYPGHQDKQPKREKWAFRVTQDKLGKGRP